jgi:hypothetical protein
VESPAHQIIFTDTRTLRSFPFDSDVGGEFLSREQLTQQIVATPPTGGRALLVVLTTNAPAVQPIRRANRLDFISNTFEHFPDVYEAWEMPSAAFDRLIAALTDKLPLVGGKRSGQVVLLSGDVHIGFATRLLYKAKARFGDISPQPATAVIAQLVGSSFRKQTDRTLGFHRMGYGYAPKWYLRLLIPRHRPEGYLGWNVLPDPQRRIGQHGGLAAGVFVPLATLTLDQSTVQIAPDSFLMGVAIDSDAAPDYSYRLDYLLPRTGGPVPPPLPIAASGSGATEADRAKAAAAFHAATGRYRLYNSGTSTLNKVIGTNNCGEITFDWSATDATQRKVNLTLRWRSKVGEPPQFTDYVVNLDPADVQHPEIEPRRVIR